jgi:hypothetical protein
MKKIWISWLKISRKLSVFLANILLTVIYFILFVPLSFVMQLFSKKSLTGHLESTKKNSFWIQRKKETQDLFWAQEQ